MNKFIKTSDEKDWRTLDYAKYTLPNGTIIYVGNRPGEQCTSQEFFDSIDGFINVTDRLVRYPKGKNAFWFPWNEAGYPSHELIFGALKTLDFWVQSPDFKTIYIHCDAGTHRAPSTFGLYLRAYHKDFEKIANSYELIGREHWSDPIEYSAGYLRDIPELQELIDAIAKAECTFEYGAMLEGVLKTIGQKNLDRYKASRYYSYELRTFLWHTKYNFKSFFTYTLWGRPLTKIKIYLHKKFNTKQGQWYKKNNF